VHYDMSRYLSMNEHVAFSNGLLKCLHKYTEIQVKIYKNVKLENSFSVDAETPMLVFYSTE